MRASAKTAILMIAVVSVPALYAFAHAAAGSRELGRSDPKAAANYRPPWFNFTETYTDGAALGVSVGSTNMEAIEAAERAGLIVEPSGWGDNRAGGANLYQRPALVDAVVRQPYLNFSDPTGKRGMTVDFRDGRVVAIRVHYINFEAI